MSTSAVHAHSSSSWKQEVNRRLAEHRSRKPAAEPAPQPSEAQTSASRRAQEAAARVAARYAKAPSFNQALASEARSALRAAEAAAEAAIQATAAAQSVLDNIEAAAARPAGPVLAVAPAPAPPVPAPVAQAQPLIQPEPDPNFTQMDGMGEHVIDQESISVLWAPDLPVRTPKRGAALRAGRGDSLFEDEWWKPASAEPLAPGAGEIEVVEPAVPIHGNLIEFPRELVAKRKARHRQAEAAVAAEQTNLQLSIFEVDPITIAPETTTENLYAASPAWTEQVWTEPVWSEPTRSETAWTEPAWPRTEPDARQIEELLAEPASAAAPAHELQPASMNRRLMALVVDGALIAGADLGAVTLALTRAQVMPGLRAIEMGSGVAFAVIAALYVALFFALAHSTPGMKYARIRLSRFDGLTPSRAQRCGRLAASLLAVLPAGMGLAWSLFDDQSLCWHDRLSRTYLSNR